MLGDYKRRPVWIQKILLLITWLDCTKSCVSISKDAPNHAGGLQDVVVSCWGAQDVVVDVGSLVRRCRWRYPLRHVLLMGW
jgi:hypothetical protein